MVIVWKVSPERLGKESMDPKVPPGLRTAPSPKRESVPPRSRQEKVLGRIDGKKGGWGGKIQSCRGEGGQCSSPAFVEGGDLVEVDGRSGRIRQENRLGEGHPGNGNIRSVGNGQGPH